jgi:hypothetical protein
MSNELVGLKLTRCLGIPLIYKGATLKAYTVHVKAGDPILVTAQYSIEEIGTLTPKMFKIELVTEESISLDQ